MRKPPKTTLLAAIIVIGLCSAAVVMTGVLVAVARAKETVLSTPLLIYPVTATTPGLCQAGQVGLTGPPQPTCYQVSTGLTIRKVGEVKVQKLGDGSFGLSVQLVGADKEAFAKLTKQNLQKQVAMVVNNQIVTAPRVDAPITGGKLLVTGQFTADNADRLAQDLTGT